MAGPMPIPPLNLNTSQQASSGAGGGNAVGGATSDWVVSYGGGVSTGQAIPTWVWVAGIVLGAWWIKKRAR